MIDNKEPIKLSICIPVYKGLETLKIQLEYFKNHMIPGVEVIVSDDASGDDTADFITEYSKEHEWMYAFVNDTNGGCDKNIRTLLGLAQGDYVFFLGDDYLADEFLDDAIRFIDDYEPSMIHFNYGSFHEGRDNYKVSKKEFKTYFEEHFATYCDRPFEMDDLAISQIIANQISHFMFMSSNIYRKASIKKCSDITVNYGTTLLYSLAALKDGVLLYVTNEYVFSDPDITWSEKKYDVWFYWMPKILNASKEFGYKQCNIQKMLDGHISQCIVSKSKTWKEMIRYLKKSGQLKLLSLNAFLLALAYKVYLLKRKISVYGRRKFNNIRRDKDGARCEKKCNFFSL